MSDSLATFQVKESCDIYDLSCHWLGISEFFTTLVLWVYESILGAASGLISAIPVPDFLRTVSSFRLPDVVVWAAEPFQLGYGVGIITSAYTLRFIIRRLPVVG